MKNLKLILFSLFSFLTLYSWGQDETLIINPINPAPEFIFRKQNNVTVLSVRSLYYKKDLTTLTGKNDAITNLLMKNVPENTVIRLYDNSKGKGNDDYISILTKTHITNKVIPSLHNTFEDDQVKVLARYRNGLNGKVSHIQIVSQGSLQSGSTSAGQGFCTFKVDINEEFDANIDCTYLIEENIFLPTSEPTPILNQMSQVCSNQGMRLALTETRDNLNCGSAINGKKKIIGDVICHCQKEGPVYFGLIEFYEDDKLRGTRELVIHDNEYNERGGSNTFENDEIRSMYLIDVPKGTIIEIYDESSWGKRFNDDYVLIEVKKDIKTYKFNTIARNISDEYIEAKYKYGGNLNGKVSRIKVHRK